MIGSFEPELECTRRQNKEFSWWSLPSSVANNTLSRLRAYHWNTTTDIGRASGEDLLSDDQARPSVVASAEMLRIQIDGDSGPSIPDSRKIAFTDPVSGNRYIASRFGTETIQGRQVDRGVASRMLERAKELLLSAYEVELDASGKAVIDKFGEPKLVIVNGLPVSKSANSEKTLRRHIGLMDALRQVGKIFGGGPLGSGANDGE